MNKNYCARIVSASGELTELFYEDFLDAVIKCTKSESAKEAKVFKYPNMKDPICIMRIKI